MPTNQSMDKLRKFVRDILMETYGPSVVQYSAVVIEDSIEEQKVRDLANQYIPEGWNKPAHYHMTIGQGPIPESLQLRGDLNKEVELTINMIGQSENSIAFGTFGYYSKNDMPHITIAFNKKFGGTAADSKEIKDWKPIERVTVIGVIREIGMGNKILKESIGDKIKVDFDSMNIMLGDKVVGDFYMYDRREKYLTITKIEIYPEYQKHGYATQTMNQIIDYANKNNLIIILTPEAYKIDSITLKKSPGMSTTALTKWYKSFGFIMNKGKHKDFEHMHLMYKLPSVSELYLRNKTVTTSPSREAHAGIPSEFPKEEDYDEFGNVIKSMGK